ncbi:hypothetical protein FRC03_004096 [Tulasnella sp. 419]|nr:hypothetical protein FRC02_008137 [Tulasnella sp. 418]KAG8970714.1 hypothetical protein FRC03_004096 [Tulasnella sp. 419]
MPMDARQAIIESVFSRRTADGSLVDNYVSHIKVYEEEPGGIKARYILLSIDWQGYGHVHKSRQNANGTFSIGKSWKLEDLREIEIVSPTSFKLSFARSYRWSTDRQDDQTSFLEAVVRLFRQVNSNGDLNIVNKGDISFRPEESMTKAQRRPHTPTGSDHVRDLNTSKRHENPALQNNPAGNSYSEFATHTHRSANMRHPRGTSSNKETAVPVGTSTHANESHITSDVVDKSNLTDTNVGVEAVQSRDQGFTTGRSPEPETKGLRDPRDSIPSGQPYLDIESSHPGETKYNLQSRKINFTEDVVEEQSQPTKTDALAMATDTERFRPDGSWNSSFQSDPQDPHQSQPSSSLADQNRHINDEAFGPLSLDLLGTEDEFVDGSMADVEEILEGIEWGLAHYPNSGSKTGKASTADLIEERLTGELLALEKANIHSFLESDERVAAVLNYINGALVELDELESRISSYKVHLNAVGDDIGHIQSQDRGLQVQIQNQMTLVNEIKQLLETLDVDHGALVALAQDSLENSKSIQRVERAAAELYKALISGRETGVAATIERLEEYQVHNTQFCKRLLDFLSTALQLQLGKLLSSTPSNTHSRGNEIVLFLPSHEPAERYLERYCGLMIYLKEMDESKYSKIAALYFSATNEAHRNEMKTVFASCSRGIKSANEQDGDLYGFSTPPLTSGIVRTGGTMKRAKTIIRSTDDRKQQKRRNAEGDMNGGQVLKELFGVLLPQMRREESFIADFFSVADVTITFADWMQMEHYFRRKASALTTPLRSSTVKLVQGGMDLIFGFLHDELKAWTDSALERDASHIMSILVVAEQVTTEAEGHRSGFIQRLLLRYRQRIHALFDRHLEEQIRDIEQAKQSNRKRSGVAQFIRYFPTYADRMESQLIGLHGSIASAQLDIAYEKILTTIFDTLQHVAKLEISDARELDREREDKGQVYYHAYLLENLHYFIKETSHLEVVQKSSFMKRAQDLYKDNLQSYVRSLIRKPMTKLLDYFNGLERLLQTMGATNVSTNPSYNRSAAKRIIKDMDAKDIRRVIDALCKRIEKHFDEDTETASSTMKTASMLGSVWKACEAEMIRDLERFNKMLSDCYPGMGLSLDYSADDISDGFRRHKM